MLNSSSDNPIVRLILLHKQPLHLYIVLRMSPVSKSIQITQVQTILQTKFDSCKSPGDLASNKSFATNWAFVIEEDTITAVNTIGLSVVNSNPVCV